MKAYELIVALLPYTNKEITYTYNNDELTLWANDGYDEIITINEKNQF